MEGPSGTQYYGIRLDEGVPLDEEAINLAIDEGTSGVQGFATSGGIQTNASLGNALDVMNPYLTTNYIIYTGK
jgi:hypothetical protein